MPASPLSCSPSGRFKTNQGIARLTAGEVATVAGETPDSHEMDLLQAMDRGDFPTWTLRDLTAGKDHPTYDLSLAILNEEIEHESWFSEFVGEGPSGHFMRHGDASPLFSTFLR